ncbi:hypothetical protein ALC53_11526 [Atta colombica]|uniref:Uncharacterized protein n=1 Tax=Atta colombica TaxID=520822 RepID=A0A195B0Q2_9HYME|nr:hypothetical protein ALC53_11526 [Atta colombica]
MPPLQLRDYSNKRRVLANVHLELAPGFTLEMRFPVTHGFTSDHSAARAAGVANGLKLDGQERRGEERRGEGRGGDEDVRREPQGADDAQPQSHVATFMHLRIPRATCGP